MITPVLSTITTFKSPANDATRRYSTLRAQNAPQKPGFYDRSIANLEPGSSIRNQSWSRRRKAVVKMSYAETRARAHEIRDLLYRGYRAAFSHDSRFRSVPSFLFLCAAFLKLGKELRVSRMRARRYQSRLTLAADSRALGHS